MAPVRLGNPHQGVGLAHRVNQPLAVPVAQVVEVVRVGDTDQMVDMGLAAGTEMAAAMETAAAMDPALAMAPVEGMAAVVMAIPMMATRMEAGRSEKVTNNGD